MRPFAAPSTRCVISPERRIVHTNSAQFPGRQKIIVSKNWGFTPLRREEYVAKRQEGRVKVDGAYVQFLRNKGNLAQNVRRFPEAFTEQEA